MQNYWNTRASICYSFSYISLVPLNTLFESLMTPAKLSAPFLSWSFGWFSNYWSKPWAAGSDSYGCTWDPSALLLAVNCGDPFMSLAALEMGGGLISQSFSLFVCCRLKVRANWSARASIYFSWGGVSKPLSYAPQSTIRSSSSFAGANWTSFFLWVNGRAGECRDPAIVFTRLKCGVFPSIVSC